MKLLMHKAGKKRAARVEVADEVFAADYNEPLVHQVITSYLSTGRSAHKSLKNRSGGERRRKKPGARKVLAGPGPARSGARSGVVAALRSQITSEITSRK